jgi:hypothetical protein
VYEREAKTIEKRVNHMLILIVSNADLFFVKCT